MTRWCASSRRLNFEDGFVRDEGVVGVDGVGDEPSVESSGDGLCAVVRVNR